MPKMDVDTLLSRFPGPLTLRPSRLKWSLVLAILLLAAAGALFSALAGDAEGWVVLILLLCLTAIPVLMMLPSATVLTLDAEGFEAIQFFRRQRARWKDVSGFEAISYRIRWSRASFVLYDDMTRKATLLRSSDAKKRLGAAAPDHNAMLPDTYGMKAEHLVELMRRWQERALTA